MVLCMLFSIDSPLCTASQLKGLCVLRTGCQQLSSILRGPASHCATLKEVVCLNDSVVAIQAKRERGTDVDEESTAKRLHVEEPKQEPAASAPSWAHAPEQTQLQSAAQAPITEHHPTVVSTLEWPDLTQRVLCEAYFSVAYFETTTCTVTRIVSRSCAPIYCPESRFVREAAVHQGFHGKLRASDVCQLFPTPTEQGGCCCWQLYH